MSPHQAEMDAEIMAYIKDNNITTASVGIVYGDELIWGRGYGVVNPGESHPRPADIHTIYRVGSITKLITNMMMFQVRDEGKLVLDDPVKVGQFIPVLIFGIKT